MKSKVVRIYETGGADKLRFEEADIAAPGVGEVVVANRAVGVNFIDIYHRTGLYPVPLPAVLGLEGAGVVAAVGAEVRGIKEGDRVGYCAGGLGAYADFRVIAAARLAALPKEISFEQAAAAMLKGMTVEYLIKRLYAVREGEFVLWHAAAGGVGQIALQWLAKIGAQVIATVGSDAKADTARRLGAAHVINYRRENTAERVREITGGRGAPVAYDSVGRDTFQATMDSLAPRGLFVSFGNASGPAPDVSPGILAQKGSLFFTRPTLMTYAAGDDEMRESAAALFAAINDGIKINIGAKWPLSEAAAAHTALEARQTEGSCVLLPDGAEGDSEEGGA